MNKQAREKVPELRFPEFLGEWGEKNLGELGEFRGGGTPNTTQDNYWNGNIPWVSSSDIIEDDIYKINISRFISEIALKESATKIIPKNSILIVSRVGVGKIALSESEICTSQDFCNFTPFTEDSEYLALYISSKKQSLLSLCQGTSIKGLTSLELKGFKISLPSLPEQKKIADFLSNVDRKIDLMTKKHKALEDYKKGMMQQIFSQKIRFKDEQGNDYPEWEEKKLGDVFERVTRKNTEDNKNVLTISAQYGLINQEEFFNKSVSAENVTGYYLLHENEFAYNKSYSKGYPMGAIKKLKRYHKGVVSTLYICFKMKPHNDDNFFEQYFDSGLLNKELEKIAQEGARNHGLLNLSVVEFFRDLNLLVPSLPEQKKIADFLSSLDGKISNAQKQIDGIKQFKKALLQKMFF